MLDPSHNIFIPKSSKYDLVEQENIDKMFNVSILEIVIHLAVSVGGIGFLMNNPGTVIYNNTMMGVQFLESCRKYDVEKVVLIGTVCSYPQNN